MGFSKVDIGKRAIYNYHVNHDKTNQKVPYEAVECWYPQTVHQERIFILNKLKELSGGTDGKIVELTEQTAPLLFMTAGYDETKKGYIRSQGGVQTTDRENDEMITVQNVFIVKTEHNIIDNYGRRSIDLQSGGQGYLLQNGKMLEVTWMNDSGRLVPTKNGEVIPYIPGKTWINVVEDKESAVNFTTPN